MEARRQQEERRRGGGRTLEDGDRGERRQKRQRGKADRSVPVVEAQAVSTGETIRLGEEAIVSVRPAGPHDLNEHGTSAATPPLPTPEYLSIHLIRRKKYKTLDALGIALTNTTTIQQVDLEQQQEQQLQSDTERLMVTWIDPQSPLRSSNLRINDILLSLNGTPLQTMATATTNLDPLRVLNDTLAQAHETKASTLVFVARHAEGNSKIVSTTVEKKRARQSLGLDFEHNNRGSLVICKISRKGLLLESLLNRGDRVLAINDTGFTTLGNTPRQARKAVLAATGFVTLCTETLISTGVVIAQGVVDLPPLPPPLPLPEMPLDAAVTASPISATADPTIVVEGQPPSENGENSNQNNNQEDVSIQHVVSKWWLGLSNRTRKLILIGTFVIMAIVCSIIISSSGRDGSQEKSSQSRRFFPCFQAKQLTLDGAALTAETDQWSAQDVQSCSFTRAVLEHRHWYYWDASRLMDVDITICDPFGPRLGFSLYELDPGGEMTYDSLAACQQGLSCRVTETAVTPLSACRTTTYTIQPGQYYISAFQIEDASGWSPSSYSIAVQEHFSSGYPLGRKPTAPPARAQDP